MVGFYSDNNVRDTAKSSMIGLEIPGMTWIALGKGQLSHSPSVSQSRNRLMMAASNDAHIGLRSAVLLPTPRELPHERATNALPYRLPRQALDVCASISDPGQEMGRNPIACVHSAMRCSVLSLQTSALLKRRPDIITYLPQDSIRQNTLSSQAIQDDIKSRPGW